MDDETHLLFPTLPLSGGKNPYSSAMEGDLAQLIVFQKSGTDLLRPREEDGKNCLQIAEESLASVKELDLCPGRANDLEKCVEFLRGLLDPTNSAMKW